MYVCNVSCESNDLFASFKCIKYHPISKYSDICLARHSNVLCYMGRLCQRFQTLTFTNCNLSELRFMLNEWENSNSVVNWANRTFAICIRRIQKRSISILHFVSSGSVLFLLFSLNAICKCVTVETVDFLIAIPDWSALRSTICPISMQNTVESNAISRAQSFHMYVKFLPLQNE